MRRGARPCGALILGADYRALGAARSLGRRGVPVWMLAERADPLATVSRYARRHIVWPQSDDVGRVAFLRDLAATSRIKGWAVIPSADNTAGMVARSHHELSEDYLLTTPSWEAVRWAYDKRLTYELAERVGVPCPATVRVRDGLDPATGRTSFPAVLKPAVKEKSNALTTAKAWRIDSRDELERRYREACELMNPELLVVQELVFGGGEGQFSYAALCRDGEPLAALTARRTRQYPADFGRASTFVETIDCPEVVEPSLRLLRELRWTGLVELEYKRDSRDGVLKLLDMNPRIWGWHTLCGRAGIDFPWLLWQLACGEEIPSLHPRIGVRWLRFTTDTPTAVREMLARRLPLREYARSLRRPRESAIFAWDDPMPGLAEIPVLAYMVTRRLLHGEAV
jgi:D-aspartate ligase